MSGPGPRAVLVGLPGSGKTTVGRLLAARLGTGFADSDDAVAQAAGTTIPAYFAAHGEESFRALEHEVITRLLAEHDGVLALGGGAVLHPGTRAALAGHPVVHLDAADDALLGRVSGDGSRPLLTGDPAGKLERLRAERAPLYAEVAGQALDTSGRRAEELAGELAALLPVRVAVGGERPYDVLIGRGLSGEVTRAVTAAGAGRAFIVHAAATADQAQRVRDSLEAAGIRAVTHLLPDAEEAKSYAALTACWDRLGAERFGREDVVVAVGGGATTDVGGFVAATWLRGVPVIQVPTTLLAMVDAAVGGKTGINTGAGKNLVGAFHPPAAVLCDLDALDTLPPADLRAGLAEVVKCGFIADERILELVEAGPAAAADPASPVLRELVERAVAVKARVVGEDLRESGLREILNYGHTFAHAIERVEGYRWRHGEAVAVGMVFVAELARAAGLLGADVVARHRALLESLALPTAYRGAAAWEELADAMASDKKVRGNALRFVVLEAVGAPRVLRAPEPRHLHAAHRAVTERR